LKRKGGKGQRALTITIIVHVMIGTAFLAVGL